MGRLPEWLGTLALAGALGATHGVARAQGGEPPPLIVLTETGESREGLPVFAPHPEPGPTVAVLTRGLSGELLGVYRMTQHYLYRLGGPEPRPAYVLLSGHQGGFAKYGFWIGATRLEGVAYVDVSRDWPLSGEFGAIDQIFPHELWHAIRRQVAGAQDEGCANQVHALGVRTDRGVAFNEGFAESFQALAIDHPDADPGTRALAADAKALTRVQADLRVYARELEARWAVASRWRTGFVLWFANGEDVLRYHGIRDNLFVSDPLMPARLLDRDDPYAAYLYESIEPGDPRGPRRSQARMLSVEAVEAALGYAWAGDEELRTTYRDASFYARFDATADEVSPLQNVWLKMIHVMHERQAQDAAQLIDGYDDMFPEEAPALERVVRKVFGVARLEPPAEIWLANEEFHTGTTLFDQFRGLPRTHTFDLNAASLVDLRGVPGIDLDLAARIRSGAPYGTLDDLRRIDGVSPSVLDRFEAMRAAMQRLQARADDDEESLSILSILMPSILRLVGTVIVGAILGAILYRRVRRYRPTVRAPSWFRCALDGFAAALVGVIAGWAGGTSYGLASLAAVALLFGAPAASICLMRRRDRGEAAAVLLAWIAATLPAALGVTPLF